MKTVNTQREITPKVGKPELRFMCLAVINLWRGNEYC